MYLMLFVTLDFQDEAHLVIHS